ncbi:response regulator [Pararhizobium haloflavum]|uniref:response regulator n=1 Tax=Pararhizobium haloflavum TaxID=2037914 RepID=UPI0018E4D1C4|nr:response regulator [Pararhizobium haloflavum]
MATDSVQQPHIGRRKATAQSVLLVDSDLTFLDRVRSELEQYEVDCHVASSADEALIRFGEQGSISFVIANIDLPRISGIELIRKLSFWKRRYFAGILVANDATFDDAISALRHGVTDFLLKPVSTDELMSAINRAMVTRVGEGDGGRESVTIEGREKIIAHLTSARNARQHILGDRELSDIAWHMFLEIALAEGLGRKISVSSACVASHAPSATALRHLARLENYGLVKRTEDPADRRSWLLSLTDSGHQVRDQFIDRITRGGILRFDAQQTRRDLY